MLALIQFFFELSLLRRTPQDLPASQALLAVVLGAELLAGLAAGIAAGIAAWVALAQGLAELGLTLGALYLALSLVGHPRRFVQSATALLGTGALIGTLAIAPLALGTSGGDGSDAAAIGALLLLALVVWNVLVTGHILRHTFGITLGQGTAVAVVFEVFAITSIGGLFG